MWGDWRSWKQRCRCWLCLLLNAWQRTAVNQRVLSKRECDVMNNAFPSWLGIKEAMWNTKPPESADLLGGFTYWMIIITFSNIHTELEHLNRSLAEQRLNTLQTLPWLNTCLVSKCKCSVNPSCMLEQIWKKEHNVFTVTKFPQWENFQNPPAKSRKRSANRQAVSRGRAVSLGLCGTNT